MKLLSKLTALLCSGAMLAAGAAEPFCAFAAETDKTVCFSADQITAEQGETVPYSFRITKNTAGFSVGGFRFTFTEPLSVKMKSAERPDYTITLDSVNSLSKTAIKSPDKQEYGFVCCGGENVTETGEFITFQVIVPEDAAAKRYAVEIFCDECYTAAGEPVAFEVEQGWIEVKEKISDNPTTTPTTTTTTYFEDITTLPDPTTTPASTPPTSTTPTSTTPTTTTTTYTFPVSDKPTTTPTTTTTTSTSTSTSTTTTTTSTSTSTSTTTTSTSTSTSTSTTSTSTSTSTTTTSTSTSTTTTSTSTSTSTTTTSTSTTYIESVETTTTTTNDRADVYVKNVDQDGNPLAGAVISITGTTLNKVPVKFRNDSLDLNEDSVLVSGSGDSLVWKTGKSAEPVHVSLPDGIYAVCEITVPSGYTHITDYRIEIVNRQITRINNVDSKGVDTLTLKDQSKTASVTTTTTTVTTTTSTSTTTTTTNTAHDQSTVSSTKPTSVTITVTTTSSSTRPTTTTVTTTRSDDHPTSTTSTKPTTVTTTVTTTSGSTRPTTTSTTVTSTISSTKPTVSTTTTTAVSSTKPTVTTTTTTHTGTVTTTVPTATTQSDKQDTGKSSESTTVTTTTVSDSGIVTTTARPDYAWGYDNWGFINSFRTLCKQGDQSSLYISKEARTALNEQLSNVEIAKINEALAQKPAGANFGMAVTSILHNYGVFKASDLVDGTAKLYDINSKNINDDVRSAITYYQMMQYTKNLTQAVYQSGQTDKEKLQKLIASVKEKKPTLLTYTYEQNKDLYVGESVVAYGIIENTHVIKTLSATEQKTYNVEIKIYNSSATEMTDRYNLFINTNTWEWLIPVTDKDKELGTEAITNSTKHKSGKLALVTADEKLLNSFGLFNGVKDYTRDASQPYYATMITNRFLKSYSLEVDRSTKVYGDGSTEFASNLMLSGNSDARYMDARNSYVISLADSDRLNMSMEYEHCLLRANSEQFKKLTVRPNGEITVGGNGGAYQLSMVMDEGYHPTHWHTVTVSGKDGGDLSLRYIESQNGWILSGGSLNDVTVTANNYKNFPRVRFSTNQKNVLIYEIDEDTIGIAVDANNDGSFERTIARGMRGDVNADK